MPHEASRAYDNTRALRCLWIARYLPYPLDAGAKVYSAKLAEAVAGAGVRLRFLGFGAPAAQPGNVGVEWVAVPGKKRNRVAALLSSLPLAAAIDATPAYKAALREHLAEAWDMICLDGYAAGWALQVCTDYRRPGSGTAAIVVHVSHNHEAVLWQSMARESKVPLPQRIVLWQNYWKVRALEQRLVRRTDLLTAITVEDRQSLGAVAARCITLTPGYQGAMVTERGISDATARRVVIVGSFRWIMKQENLRCFIEIADAAFHRAGIALDIVGDVPEELRERLQRQCRATVFHGFVDDLNAVMAAARVAVVPEKIGGGFKLKFLDYVFARVPVATLTQAVAGLPAELRREVLACDDLAQLVDTIVDVIDRPELLNGLQERAFAAAAALFRWEDRGRQLAGAAAALVDERSAPGATACRLTARNRSRPFHRAEDMT